MSMLGAILAWAAAFVVGYVYVGYPILIGIIGWLMPKPVRQSPIEPTVTLLVSAFNEAHVIGEKLKNALELDYPKSKMKILVISDASTDLTDQIVQSFSGASRRPGRKMTGRFGL